MDKSSQDLINALRRRRGIKWSQYAGTDVIPAWVADMDFDVAPVVRDAVVALAEAGDLGYPPDDGVAEAYADRAQRRWGWRPDVSYAHLLANVVRGIANVIEAFTAPGDGVVMQTPIYPPFVRVTEALGRRAIQIPLGEPLPEGAARLALLCHPHNPTGHVFGREELIAIAQWAERNDAVVAADELHADLVYPGRTHIPFASVSDEASARTVTLFAASKTFNIAGLRCSLAVAGSARLHEALHALAPFTRDGASIVGIEATLAAWSPAGDRWVDECLATLDENRRWLAGAMTERLPAIGFRLPEATYLAWLDCRSLGLAPDPAAFFLEHAAVALSDGAAFGNGGAGHVRLNFATYLPVLREIIDRMEAALRRRADGGRTR